MEVIILLPPFLKLHVTCVTYNGSLMCSYWVLIWDNLPPWTAVNGSTIACDFEDGTHCGWVEDPDHDTDWIVHRHSTPTEGTGPLYDHTFGREGNGKSWGHWNTHTHIYTHTHTHTWATSFTICSRVNYCVCQEGKLTSIVFVVASSLCKVDLALEKTEGEVKSKL